MSTDLPPLPATPTGRYRHYKGGEYEVIGVARHSETLEPMVVYRPLYNASGLWVRPHCMFFEMIEVAGQSQPRFRPVDEGSGNTDWESRVANAWAAVGTLSPEAHVAEIDKLAAERPVGDAAALFERGAARDTAGMESEAEGFYRQALAAKGLDSYRRARATIQLASTLRLLGRLAESEAMLVALLEAHGQPGASQALHDEARAFLSLTYAAQGRTKEAAGIALVTLAPYLSRYKQSVAGNAAELAKNVVVASPA